MENNEHNKHFVKGEVTFKRKIWEFSDLTLDEYNKHLNGFKRNVQSRSFIQDFELDLPINYIAPQEVNWIERGYVTSVRNQG